MHRRAIQEREVRRGEAYRDPALTCELLCSKSSSDPNALKKLGPSLDALTGTAGWDYNNIEGVSIKRVSGLKLKPGWARSKRMSGRWGRRALLGGNSLEKEREVCTANG
jgi:hypothetical protein